ncbi:MAG: flippase [Acidobacteria bacterium]|nr:MAG: flippase [Acidobacteriota bacterium]
MGLARNAVEVFVTKGLVAVFGLLITVLVARTLGPVGRGAFSAAMAVAAIGVQIGNFGLASSNIYYASSRRDLIKYLVGNSLFIGVGVSAVVGFLAWGTFQYRPDLAPLRGWMLALSLMWVPVGIGMLLMQNLLLGMQQVRMFNLIELLKQVGTLLAIVVAWLIHLDSPEGYFAASLLVLMAMFVWSTVYIVSEDGSRPMVSFSLFRMQARYAAKAYLATIFSYLVLRIDLLMIQYIQGDAQTGLYSVAVAIADVLYLLPVAVGTVLFPRLSALKDESARWVLTARAMRWTALIMAVSALVLMVSVKILLELLFGEAYLPAAPAAMILLPAVALLGVNTLLMNYFASLGMPMFTMVSPGVATAINVPANYFLIPNLGIVGAAWASLASYGIMLLMSLGFVWMLRNGYGKE